MSQSAQVNIEVFHPDTDDEVDGMHLVRHKLTLEGMSGREYTFLIDIPLDDTDLVDVWMLDSVVEIGDGPDDGFATFTPKDQTIGLVTEDMVSKA